MLRGRTLTALTDDQQALKDLAARLAADRFAPNARAWDDTASPLPPEERRRLADLGLIGLCLPVEYGGGGRPLIDALIVIEELAKASPLAAWPVFESCAGPARAVELLGNEDLCNGSCRRLRRRETTASSISEPDAGSAATDLSTTARVEGGEVVINGVKRWCSGAGHAEMYLVYARFGSTPGSASIGAVLVPRETQGLSFGPQERLMGFRGVGSADMFLDDVRLPVENIVVAGGGFKALFAAFSIERLGNATMSLAIAQSALDRTAAYVTSRRQFGRSIADFQLVQAGIADMVIQVEAARLLIRPAAISAGNGAPPPLEASVAKCFAN